MASVLTIQNARLIGAKALERAIVKAFEQWAETDINEDHWDAQFRDMDRWDWPNETKRRNGRIVDSPRDIYDLGKLYRSGVESFKLTTQNNRTEAYWRWDAKNSSGVEYAWYVHEGTRFMDGRPFTDDISIASSFWRKEPGQALKLQVETELARLNAR
jgi:hypothetical protein